MKKSFVIASILSASVLAMTGCETAETKKSADAAPAKAAPAKSAEQVAYEKAVAAAKAEIKKAKGAGGEWRDSGKMLKKADAAAAKGDYAKATKIANNAAFQGKMGQSQAAAEKGVGNPGYLY
ncbi:MAG: SoxXA-binding protein [bacterium]